MPVNRAYWCKVRGNQGLSLTTLCTSNNCWGLVHKNTQYVKLQSLNDGSSWLPLPKITLRIWMQMQAVLLLV